MGEKLRIGLAGGGIGQQHIYAFQCLPAQFEAVAICDLNEARACEVADKYQIPRVTTDFAELCGMNDLDLIDICTPSHLHAAQSLEALVTGKHVICEKPVAGSLREVDELSQAEVQSGKRVMPIFQYRFGHGLQKLKFLVDAGLAGQAYLTTVETAWRRRAAYYAAPLARQMGHGTRGRPGHPGRARPRCAVLYPGSGQERLRPHRDHG